MIQIIAGDNRICADGCVPIAEENAIQLYKEKSDLDYIPPVKVSVDLLSDFGEELLCRNTKKSS